MNKTLSDARTEIQTFLLGETIISTIIDAAINDAIESIWQSLIRANLSNHIGGPVTISAVAGDQRIALSSITDPTTAPTISEVTSGALAAHTIYGAYTLATDSGSETLPSATTTQAIAINKVAKMITPAFAAGALGWNCYMGTASDRMAKQNTNPTAFGTDYTESTSGAAVLPNAPGVPTSNTTNDDLFYIRRIETSTTNGTYLSWDAADIDSAMMRQAAGLIGVASQYQTYVWDLLDSNSIEIRPVVALAASPRYFYIKKPRRLAFDSSLIPFTHLPVSEFLRSYALMKIFMMVREWASVKAHSDLARDARNILVQAVVQQNIPKNQKVTPFMYA